MQQRYVPLSLVDLEEVVCVLRATEQLKEILVVGDHHQLEVTLLRPVLDDPAAAAAAAVGSAAAAMLSTL